MADSITTEVINIFTPNIPSDGTDLEFIFEDQVLEGSSSEHDFVRFQNVSDERISVSVVSFQGMVDPFVLKRDASFGPFGKLQGFIARTVDINGNTTSAPSILEVVLERKV